MLNLLVLVFISFTMVVAANAQDDNRKFRIAKIEVYPQYLEEYKAALAEHTKDAVLLEPGVLALQAVYDKSSPLNVTVFEVYANEKAYQMHLKTKHFLKSSLDYFKQFDITDWLNQIWRYAQEVIIESNYQSYSRFSAT